ncbi:DUF2442 domain-containing protein [Novosphingobium sp. KN65.2]|uniref:DUF2442 domain-containing protein n=1 Tax=Novosphingobium sp. KN65.2 TaxID=1478134 RepID=UPI0005E19A82|nr:DUF2442 domain-containing protein [Novosphingobium sp. KN65.2]CDO38967.1 hypothetical protein SPHV1_910007 [Novosphingobium sp. KN65.2]
MNSITDAQIDAAIERSKIAVETEPRAASARYDRQLDRVIVDSTNGCTFAFPPRITQGLETATADQLAEVEILGLGYGLHWEALDVDFSPWLNGRDPGHPSLHGSPCRTGNIRG